jgi:galactose-1-phosphate uridylyltransferase
MKAKRPASEFLEVMRDGTVKMVNPLTGRTAWYVPGRAVRPITNAPERAQGAAPGHRVEDACDFCEANYLKTPPEKERLILRNGSLHSLAEVPASALSRTAAEFRRVANLFEVVPYDYWIQNHGFRLPPACVRHMEAYLSEEAGRRHVSGLVRMKLELAGRSGKEAAALSEAERRRLAEALFGGSHDLIVARQHTRHGGVEDARPAGSGDLGQEEHHAYLKFTIRAVRDIFSRNPHVRYVTAFQNWLHVAGASFDHLHKQLVGFDGWGPLIEEEARAARANPRVYLDDVVGLAADQGRILAENDHAVLLVDLGHRHPTLAIYSKSRSLRPWEQTEEEIRGFSDLLHAAHRAQGSELPSNEDWIYAPPACRERIPWHLWLRWRVNNPSGFEGGTEIYIHPVTPHQMREALLPRLADLQAKEGLKGFRIVQEDSAPGSSLRYLEGT